MVNYCTYYPAEFKIARENRYVGKIRMILVSVVCRPAGHKITKTDNPRIRDQQGGIGVQNLVSCFDLPPGGGNAVYTLKAIHISNMRSTECIFQYICMPFTSTDR